MEFFKQFFREVGLHIAFIVMSALLLLSFWLSQNVSQSVLAEFKYQSLSLVLKAELTPELREYLQSSRDVVRYDVQSAHENREELMRYFPEIEPTLGDLDEAYFPVSVLITTENVESLVQGLKSFEGLIESQMVHAPPSKLVSLFHWAMGLFLFLWFLILSLLVYFQLDRLAVKDSARWSLMKMLGAKPSQIFLPICWTQALRLAIGGVLGIALFSLAADYLREVFDWSWPALSVWVQATFFTACLAIGMGLFFTVFSFRYRRTALG